MSERARHEHGDTEEFDALPVPADPASGGEPGGALPEVGPPHPIAPAPGSARSLADLRAASALQAAAAAAGGFVAGAAVVRLARRRQSTPAPAVGRARRSGGRRSKRGRRRRGELTQVVASRSFLVDVHLLGPADRGR